MLHVITGASASGKSAFAEDLLLSFGLPEKYYLATMEVFSEEAGKRIARHQMMRKEKGFVTIEAQRDLDQLNTCFVSSGGPDKRAVLLECMSNLVANELFFEDALPGYVYEKIFCAIEHLLVCCRELVVVTNEVFADGVCYPPETMQYLALLGKVNRELFKRAANVTEVVYGIPVPIKKQKG